MTWLSAQKNKSQSFGFDLTVAKITVGNGKGSLNVNREFVTKSQETLFDMNKCQNETYFI